MTPPTLDACHMKDGPVVAAIFWPLAMPVSLGILVVRRITEWRDRVRIPKATARKGA